MLNAFFVRNFRLFNHLDLPHLGRVNLIAGKNSSGKSALLEAIRLYASHAAPGVLADLVLSRKEYWSPKEPGFDEPASGQVLRHLFYGRQLPELNGEGIRIGESTEEHCHLTTEAYVPLEGGYVQRVPSPQPVMARDESLMGTPLTTKDIKKLSDDISFRDKYLVLEYKGQTHPLVNLDKHLKDQTRAAHDHSRYAVQVVRPQSADPNELASLWDKTVLTSLEAEVIAGLQLIERDIKRLSFVDAEDFRVRIPMVQHRDSPEPLSLQSFGEGILRLFEILLSLVNAKNGILLIDELENGLHYKIHPQVWDLIFRLSKKLNVQIFATTHSWDCIRGFKAAWREDLDAGTFFRLDVKVDKVKPTYYDHEVLNDAFIANVEVR